MFTPLSDGGGLWWRRRRPTSVSSSGRNKRRSGRVHRGSDEPCLRPPFFKGRMKERCRGLARELPLPCHPHVLLLIDACPPHRPIPRAQCARHEEIPLCPGRVALHVNLPIEAVVDRKGEELRGPTEERPDRLPPFKPPQALAFPHRVLREERGKTIGVVLVITVGGVARLEVTDGVDVFQGLHPLLELGQAGTLAELWHGHEVAPRFGSYARRRSRMPSAHPTSRQTRSAPYRITATMTRGADSTGHLQQPPCSSDPMPGGG